MPATRIPSTVSEYVQSGDVVLSRGDEEGNLHQVPRGAHFLAVLQKMSAALGADEAFVLVDLSDTTNFPHTEVGKVRLLRIEIDWEADTDGTGILYIGVITEVDATNGTAIWLDAIRLHTDLDGTDSTDYRHLVREYYGLDLEVDTANDVLYHVATNATQAGHVNWQTDVALDSPAGDATSAPGDGDLVAWLDWTAGNVYMTIKTLYWTEA